MAEVQLEPRRSFAPEQQGLDISVRTGSGSGRTLLSAFDHALQGAGVADFNLVTLSSVIPTGSRIRHVNGRLQGGHGDLLFCVRSQAFAEHAGETVWAGLGWCLDETGGGLFVEHHGGSERAVAEQIEVSLADMTATRGGGYGQVQMALASAHSTGIPACAVVVASYRVSTWHEPGQEHRAGTTEMSQLGGHDDMPGLDDSPIAARAGVVPQRSSPVGASQADGSGAAAATSGAPEITVSVEKEVDYLTAVRYYQLYRETFGELETKAVARQLLHESEFMEEMLDPRVHKYIAWSADQEAIGMTTLTSDLETVPWISPRYFAHHYPDHFARGAVYYLGFTLVHPEHRGAQVFYAMIEEMTRLVATQPVVVAWDMCLVNDEQGLGGSAGRLLSSLADVSIVPIDRQTYYAGTFQGLRESSRPG